MSKRDLATVFNSSLPATTKREWVHAPIVCVDTHGPLRFRMLSEAVWGLKLHHDGRSFICTGKRECPGCVAELPRRWAGWVSACSWDYRCTWVVKVSAGADRQLAGLRTRHPRLVGLPLMFKRQARHSNSAVLVSLGQPLECSWDHLPPAFDPRGAVLNLHQIDADTINQLVRQSSPLQPTPETPMDT